jgi:hypothetical protein
MSRNICGWLKKILEKTMPALYSVVSSVSQYCMEIVLQEKYMGQKADCDE